ncbi:hypothetical protein Tco_0047062 [Tanacetum coccineum]
MIMGLQETKKDRMEENEVQYIWGSDSFGFAKVDAIGSADDVLTIWNNSWIFDTTAMGEEVVAKERKLSDNFPLILMDKCTRQELEKLKSEATKWELIAESRDLDEGELERRKEARREWIEKDKHKNEMLKQKARSKWVLEADENSKSFHSYIRGNVRKTKVNGLMVDGGWCEDPTTIKAKVYDFFTNAY